MNWIQTVDEWAKNVKRNIRMDLTLELTKIVFKVIAKILFGTDLDNMPPIQYKSPKTGEILNLDMDEFFLQYSRDEFNGALNPKQILIPFISKFALVEPYKSNKINNRSFFEAIKSFTKVTKDTESVYKKTRGSWKVLRRYSYQRYYNTLLIILLIWIVIKLIILILKN